jgi:hypothetical protein
LSAPGPTQQGVSVDGRWLDEPNEAADPPGCVAMLSMDCVEQP